MNDNCVFCDRANFEERIVAENSDYFIIATLGQITDGGHLLLVPKLHTPCVGALTLEQMYSLKEAMVDVCLLLSSGFCTNSKEGSPPITTFEHGVVGQTVEHTHLHLLPAAVNFTPSIRADFPDAKIEKLQNYTQLLTQYAKKNESYLYWTTPSGEAMVCWNPPAPHQYLRLIAAKLLGTPERSNWHDTDRVLDKQLISETVTRLKHWFMRYNWTT